MLLFLEKNYAGALFGIAVLSFCLSIAYSAYFHLAPIVDARAYESIALDIVKTGVYPDDAINRPGPGYELFLAFVFFVFGHSLWAVWAIQAGLLALSAALVGLTVRDVLGGTWPWAVGLLAAAFVGFSPDLIMMTNMLMTEILVVFFVSAFVFFLFRYVRESYFVRLAAAALILTLAVFTRGNLLLLLLPAVWLIWQKTGSRRAVMFVLIFGALLVPWTLHNYIAYKQLKPFNGSTGLLYVGNHAGATGELMVDYKLPPGIDASMPQLEFDDALGRAGVEYIKSHPLDFLRLSLVRMSIFFSLARPFAFWPHLHGLSQLLMIIASGAYGALIFFGGLFGAILLLMEKMADRQKIFAVVALALTVPASIAALIVETRYRLPAYPLLTILAAFGWYALFNSWRELAASRKYLVLASAFLILNTAVDIWRNFERISEKLF